MENEERADRIEAILSTDYGDTPETDAVDLLTDLRHYCAREGLQFDQLLESSANHFEVEKKEG